MPPDYYKKIREEYQRDPKRYWDCMARKYRNEDAVLVPGDLRAKNLYYDSLQRKVLSKVFGHLEVGSEILDVGCGIGRWSFELAKRGMNVIGIDISDEMISVAEALARREGITNVSFLVSEASEISFPDQRFDGVLAITVLQHIVDDKERLLAIDKMISATKKRGKLLVLEKVIPEKFKEFHTNPLMETDWIELFSSKGARFLDSHPVPNSPLLDFVTYLATITYFATRFSYRSDAEVKQYPGMKSVHETVSRPIRLAYEIVSYAAIAFSKPFHIVLTNKMFGKLSKHKLMIFERI